MRESLRHWDHIVTIFIEPLGWAEGLLVHRFRLPWSSDSPLLSAQLILELKVSRKFMYECLSGENAEGLKQSSGGEDGEEGTDFSDIFKEETIEIPASFV